MIKHVFAAFMLLPSLAAAEGITVEKPMVPLAPPGAMAHAAFMTLTNTGDTARQLIGVTAEGYKMAHIHLSAEANGVATMSAVDVIEIAPDQTVALEHGGLHIMLMHPLGPVREGDRVALTLEFANGETKAVTAMVMKMGHGHS